LLRSRLLCFICLTAFSVVTLAAAQPSVELSQAFLDLRNDAVLMCVSAHPDDEDGATLAYYRMKWGVKTCSVFLTRGEGGQNEKGPELYEELGVLRSAETRAAGALQGTDVYFLNFKDFGFSKSATEAFHKWGRDEVLRRLVFINRKLKPDVIISNMNTIDGHGHHQAAAISAIAAFDAAADSSYHPEQLSIPGVSLWQPKKFLFRNFDRRDFGLPDWGRVDVINDITAIDSARHMSYSEIAASALRLHRTQGMERIDLSRFTHRQSRYVLIRSSSIFDRDTTSLFGGMDVWSSESVTHLKPLREMLNLLHAGIDRDSLLSIASTVSLRASSLRSAGQLTALEDRIVLRWQDALERLVRLTCGVNFSARCADSVVVPRQRVACSVSLTSTECVLSGAKCDVEVPAGWAVNEAMGAAPVLDKHAFATELSFVIGEAPLVTLPRSVAQYSPIENAQKTIARVRCSIAGYPFVFTEPVLLDIAPPQTFAVTPQVVWMSPESFTQGKSFSYEVKNYRPAEMAGKVSVELPSGWKGETAAYKIMHEDSSARGLITVRPGGNTKPGDYVLRFKTEYAVQEIQAHVFDVAVDRGARVGIIESYDNTLEMSVRELGVPVMMLKEKDLAGGSLSRYSTIIIDIRAYLVRDDLKKYNARLLEYVRNGGNLLVMYQRPQEWKPEYAPYPFQISDKRVTDEDASIEILLADHPLFNTPNLIVPDDWRDWKQERAIYLPRDVSEQYEKLLLSHDPDEVAAPTGYLVARYGKGSYIYTSYVWYRQLKEMNRGAFRCFANMISYPKYRP
jgi:LmbE family N-acetylglucosaminyl deacetylase